MQHLEARQILTSLIEGRNPGLEDRLPPDCVIHRVDVMRALLLGASALEVVDVRTKRRALLPGNVGRAWTTTEEEQLRVEFAAKEPLQVVAGKHRRTLRAVEARLQRMGLITAEQRTTRGGFTSQE